MRKSFILALSFLVILSLNVSAQSNNSDDFDPTDSYIWMIEHCDKGYCNDPTTTAFWAMALKQSGYTNTYGAQTIKSIQDNLKTSDSCYPKNGCNVKDTALSYWVLSNYGETTTGLEDYIESKLGVGLRENWWLEIVTSAENQQCKIGYPLNNELQEVTIAVDQGTFPDCNTGQAETYFDLNSCITPNLVNNNPGLELTIDCSSIGPGTIISIIYNEGSNYYLTEQATTSKYQTKLQNGCHTKSGNCHKDTSLWANWVLSLKNSDINTNLYLLTTQDNLDPVNIALLYLSTNDVAKKNAYLEQLKGLQKLDGSFNKNNYQTAIALLALKASGSTEQENSAIAYLESSVDSDASWDGEELTTALVLYAAFSDASITLPPMTSSGEDSSDDNFDNGSGSVCGDNICDPDETAFSCPSDCESTGGSSSCVENGLCEVDFGENSQNCASDCFCGDNICDPAEQLSKICNIDCGATPITSCGNNIREGSEECDGVDNSLCSQDYTCNSYCTCEPIPPVAKEKGSFTWLIIGIIIILLIIAGYILYTNSKKTKPKGHYGSIPYKGSDHNLPFSSSLDTTPRKPQPRYSSKEDNSKSQSEIELERSIKEAKKLLGGK